MPKPRESSTMGPWPSCPPGPAIWSPPASPPFPKARPPSPPAPRPHDGAPCTSNEVNAGRGGFWGRFWFLHRAGWGWAGFGAREGDGDLLVPQCPFARCLPTADDAWRWLAINPCPPQEHDKLHCRVYRHQSLNYFASKHPANYSKVWRAQVPMQGVSCSSRTKARAPGHPRGRQPNPAPAAANESGSLGAGRVGHQMLAISHRQGSPWRASLHAHQVKKAAKKRFL